MNDRDAVVSAIRTAPNLTVAARKLGASRRTLQNRMREYGLPRGRSGRPKERLPYKHGAGFVEALGAVAALTGLVLAGRWLLARHTETKSL